MGRNFKLYSDLFLPFFQDFLKLFFFISVSILFALFFFLQQHFEKALHELRIRKNVEYWDSFWAWNLLHNKLIGNVTLLFKLRSQSSTFFTVISKLINVLWDDSKVIQACESTSCKAGKFFFHQKKGSLWSIYLTNQHQFGVNFLMKMTLWWEMRGENQSLRYHPNV